MIRKMEYIGVRHKYCDIVECGDDWFDFRPTNKELPKVGAFCRKCVKETAIPVYPIYMNGKPAYALKCNKCGSEYPMYTGMYRSRYIGITTPNGGRINPTHGTTLLNAMDRKAREYHDSISQRTEDMVCEMIGCSHEEYKEMKKGWDEDRRKAQKKYENECAENNMRRMKERENEKSNTRKELIEKGVLKYVKNIGLVNTETGEVIKL